MKHTNSSKLEQLEQSLLVFHTKKTFAMNVVSFLTILGKANLEVRRC